MTTAFSGTRCVWQNVAEKQKTYAVYIREYRASLNLSSVFRHAYDLEVCEGRLTWSDAHGTGYCLDRP
jgi:hypothetical protein